MNVAESAQLRVLDRRSNGNPTRLIGLAFLDLPSVLFGPIYAGITRSVLYAEHVSVSDLRDEAKGDFSVHHSLIIGSGKPLDQRWECHGLTLAGAKDDDRYPLRVCAGTVGNEEVNVVQVHSRRTRSAVILKFD